MGKITIKDIAREANVSVGLVSMTLNGRSGVNAKTANAIMEVVKRLNYTPNKAASSLRISFQKTIGVITPDLANHYFSNVSRNIENIAYDNGYTVLFGSSDDRIDKIGRHKSLRRMRRRAPKGYLIGHQGRADEPKSARAGKCRACTAGQ